MTEGNDGEDGVQCAGCERQDRFVGGKAVGSDGSDSAVGLEYDVDFAGEVSVVDEVLERDKFFEFG